jgi:hypothetical protein
MNEPTQIAIPESELTDWLKHIERGLNPSVKFSDDAAKMQAEAYEERGKMLYYLNHRIKAFMTRPTPTP